MALYIFGGLQKKPKRLRFVMDVSSSMSKFNGSDRYDKNNALKLPIILQ
jgi:hypothetical protein